jgi:sialic acid synthase SpsE
MRTQIIAEAATNHLGDVGRALEMVDAAAELGCDYIKFQSWQARNLRPDDPGLAFHQQRELSDDAHWKLVDRCISRGINFLTTCFDAGRIPFLQSLGLKTIKIASPDCGSYPFLRQVREAFDEVIASTGMSYDVEVAGCARALQGGSFCLCHCVSIYPTPADQVNLARMDWLKQFSPRVGYSDHSLGTPAGKLAIARGAVYLEKHFTLERNPQDPLSAMSGTPDEFRELVAYAHEVEQLLGQPQRELTPVEEEARNVWIDRRGRNRAA